MDIAELLLLTLDRKGSDLHITVGLPPSVRIHGEVEPLPMPPLSRDDTHNLVFGIMNDSQKARFEGHRDIDFSLDFGEAGRFRVNAFFGRQGVGAVFRVIPTRIRTIAELGIPQIVSQMSEFERGLVLVTGPTGSGKSTTLASLIDQINTERKGHILTIEDPIEFVHPHKGCVVNQREIGAHTESFSTALRAALREDPDVILVGEMRDLETISLAVSAAETGHLVFGTLHTSSAPQTVDRIIDVFPPHQQAQVRSQLAESIRGIVAQQLIRTIDGSGRAAALEIMTGTPAVRNLIREGKTYQLQSVIQTAVKEGMQTLDQSLRELLRAGRITMEEAMKKVPDKEAFTKLLEEVPSGRGPAAFERPTTAAPAADANGGSGFNGGGMLIGIPGRK
jgi:twitching motility protein PilT